MNCGPPDWRHRARCRPGSGIEPELFFPAGSNGFSNEVQAADAKAVCALCPVRSECRTWALDTAQDYGVWGGLDEGERRTIRRARAQRNGHRRPA